MTYIVGGKLDNNPFLMIDCKVQHNETEWLFQDKVVSFNSGKHDTYFCQMGQSIIKHFITMYDYIKTYEDEKIDLFDINEIKKMFNEINSAIQYSKFEVNSKGENTLFFISKYDICKYTVKFDNESKKYNIISQVKIENNNCCTSNSILSRGVNVKQSDLKKFCKNVIEEEKMGVEDDLKDRYTFIYSTENELKYDCPFKSKNDIINQFTNMGFDNL